METIVQLCDKALYYSFALILKQKYYLKYCILCLDQMFKTIERDPPEDLH